MANIIDQIARRLVERYSRRDFVAKLGKMAAALAALTTDGMITNDTAVAASKKNCCEGGKPCHTDACPPDTIILYTWSCQNSHSHQNYICNDCYRLIHYPNYKYICTFAEDVHKKQTPADVSV
jgi:hypothetical protein